MRIFVAGDVFPNVPDGRAALAPLTPLLSTADLVFANCEGVYSDRPSLAPSRKHAMIAQRNRGAMLGEIPFHVMSLANNHMLDGGYDGLTDTLGLLREQSIAVVGAGDDLEQAHRAVILERAGRRVAFLAVCSVFPRGYEAGPARPGLAPLRVQTHYAEPDPSFWDPGLPARIVTRALPEDRARLRSAVEDARGRADTVIVACHWGSSGAGERLHDYEIELGRQIADWGADAVVCHHHHSLRGVELHRGSPIFYGLGALLHHFDPASFRPSEVAARRRRLGDAAFAEAMRFPLFPMPIAARMSGLAVLDVGGDGQIVSGFVPAEIQADGSTIPLRSGDPAAERVAERLETLSGAQGFETVLERDEYEDWAFLRVQ